ncbi:MAG: hypothetical protein MMC23_009516 [Stictis urceolatum]|nr:hypothetical protein [Stictis urceolata]
MKISNLLNKSPTSPAPSQGLTLAQCHDLKLMHHWTLYTYKTLVDRENMNSVWMESIPDMAAKHPFLMHGILSVTAFHLAYLDAQKLQNQQNGEAQDLQAQDHHAQQLQLQIQERIDVALHHHAAAITLVRPALENIVEHNCDALFAFTTVAAVAGFAKGLVTKLTKTPATQLPDPLDEMLELMCLLRGTTAVVSIAHTWISAGPLKPMLRGGDPHMLIDLPIELTTALDILAQRNYSSSLPEETQLACSDAIEKLRRYFRDPEIAQGEKGKLVAWPIMCQKEFIAALSRREPMALAISAYWGVMVQDLRDMWWAESWGRQVVGAVACLLDESWEPCLRWAKDKVGFTF